MSPSDLETLKIITGIDVEELKKVADTVDMITEEKASELMSLFQEKLNKALGNV